jgi:phage-related protein
VAGDTFDAGSVVAEARLGRDQFQYDLQQLRRELAKFERDARVTVKASLDNREVKTGADQAKTWLKSLGEYKARPEIDVTGVEQAKAAVAVVRKDLADLGRQTARPQVAVQGATQANAEIVRLKREMSTGWNRAGKAITSLVKPLSLVVGGVAAVGAGSWAAAAALQVMTTAAGGMAVLPGILAAGIATAATLKIGMSGVGEALKATASGDAEALRQALAELSPAAAAFVLEIQRLRPAWQALKLDVQERLFAGMAAAVGTLAGAYLPVLRTELAGIAGELNRTGIATAGWLSQAPQVATVALILQNTRGAAAALSPALVSVLQILTDVAAVGSTFLPGLASGFTSAAAGAAAFVREARESGQLAAWIASGLQTLTAVGSVIASVFGIVRGVLRAAGFDGAQVATSLAVIVNQWEAWVNSAAGQTVLVDFFRLAGDAARALVPLIGAVLLAAGQLVATLLPAIPPVAAGLTAVLVAASPLLGVFADLAGAVLPAVGAGLSFLAPVLGPLAGLILGVVVAVKLYTTTVAVVTAVTRGWAIAQAILNGAMLLNPIGLVVVAVAALAAALVYAWNNSETFRAVVMGAWQGIQSAASAAWGFLQGVFAALVTATQAVGQAAVWLWQTVFVPAGAGIAAAFTAIGTAATWLWSNVLQPVFDAIGLAARILVAIIVTVLVAPWLIAFNLLGMAATWLWTNAIQPAFAAIQAFLGTVWAWIDANVFQPIGVALAWLGASFTGWGQTTVGVWTMVQNAIALAWSIVNATVFQPLLAILQGALTIAMWFFRDNAVAAWNIIRDALSAGWVWLQANVFQPIINFLSGLLTPAFNTARDLIIGAWNAVRDGLAAAWNWIRDTVFNPLIGFVRDTVVGAFNTAVGAITAAWNKIRDAVAAPVRFMVNVVYNEGIVPAWNWIAGIVGLGQLSRVNLGFHSGGVVPGPSNPYADNRLARVNGGEAVMRPEFTTAVGVKWVASMNRLAATGGPQGIRRALNSGAIVEGADHNGLGSSQSGFGGVRPHVAQAGHYLKRKFGIGTVGGVGQRAGPSDHPKGLALDFMTSGNNGTALADFVRGGANKSHFGVTYVIWRQRIDSGGGWRGMENRGNPTANHFDHVHVSFGGPGSGAMEGGLLDELIKRWATVISAMARVGEFGGTGFGQGVVGLLQKIVPAAWNWLVGAIGGGIGVRAQQPHEQLPFDQGGYLPMGTSMVTNNTGAPEPVLTPQQWRAITASPRPIAGPGGRGDSFDRLTKTMADVRELLERRGAGATVNINGSQGSPQENARAAVLQLRLS